MQAEMPSHWETENLTSSLDSGTPSLAIRAKVTQALLRASKRDCNNSRDRFIPRASLAGIINAELVGQLLQTISEKCTEDANHKQQVVQFICPNHGECPCGHGHCLGRRMIFAILLLCGRDNAILSFLPPAESQLCDSKLPLRLNSLEQFGYGLDADEKELFTYFQWLVYTPFLPTITSGNWDDVTTFPNEVSLPWMEQERMRQKQPGEVSYVEKIKIHNLNHDLTKDNNNVFALKTFEQRLAPRLSLARFRREVEANLDTQKHDRIVRLLTAFSYRERFYLIFPLATEGSLERLWKEFVPEGIAQQSTQVGVAHWYSDDWLIGECLGIAEALLAVHGLVVDRPEDNEGLLHADIKAENILCFSKSDGRNPSIVLKLADFGEAKRAKWDLKASNVAHVKTYRPPEHSEDNAITLNYDVWCLGCLFLDFITWALLGQDGINDFIRKRTDEPDDPAVNENPGQIIEDTFFKRAQKESMPSILKRLDWGRNRKMEVDSGRATTTYSLWAASHLDITSQLKEAVISHLATLQQHHRCGDQLNEILSFIGDKMLVVDPDGRANSREVRDFLRFDGL